MLCVKRDSLFPLGDPTLLRRQLLHRWYIRQQRVRARVMIRFLVRGRVRITIRIRITVRVRVGVTFNVRIYHWSNCRRSTCPTFLPWDLGIIKFVSPSILQQAESLNGIYTFLCLFQRFKSLTWIIIVANVSLLFQVSDGLSSWTLITIL